MQHQASLQSRILPLIICVALAIAGRAHAQGAVDSPSSTARVPFDLSLVHPLNFVHAERKIITGLSLNIIHGTTTSIYGVEIGGIVNHASEDALGIRIAGIVNITKRRAAGLQLSGAVNLVSGDCDGAMLSSIATTCGGNGMGLLFSGIVTDAKDFTGLQLSGLINAAKNFDGIQLSSVNGASSHFRGIQVSGLFNWNTSLAELAMALSAAGDHYAGQVEHYSLKYDANGITEGLQLTGIGNTAIALRGAQISGLFNSSVRRVEGGQVSGLMNITGDLTGGQVSLINVARDVYGFQIGLVNVARRLAGVQIGLANIAYNNGLPFMVLVNAGFESFPRDPNGAPAPQDREVEVHYVSSL